MNLNKVQKIITKKKDGCKKLRCWHIFRIFSDMGRHEGHFSLPHAHSVLLSPHLIQQGLNEILL